MEQRPQGPVAEALVVALDISRSRYTGHAPWSRRAAAACAPARPRPPRRRATRPTRRPPRRPATAGTPPHRSPTRPPSAGTSARGPTGPPRTARRLEPRAADARRPAGPSPPARCSRSGEEHRKRGPWWYPSRSGRAPGPDGGGRRGGGGAGRPRADDEARDRAPPAPSHRRSRIVRSPEGRTAGKPDAGRRHPAPRAPHAGRQPASALHCPRGTESDGGPRWTCPSRPCWCRPTSRRSGTRRSASPSASPKDHHARLFVATVLEFPPPPNPMYAHYYPMPTPGQKAPPAPPRSPRSRRSCPMRSRPASPGSR